MTLFSTEGRCASSIKKVQREIDSNQTKLNCHIVSLTLFIASTR